MNDLLEATRLLNALREEASSGLTSHHLELLHKYIERKPEGYFSEQRSPQCRIAVAVLEEILASDKCPTMLLADLVRVGRRAEISVPKVIQRIIGERAWSELRPIFDLNDAETTNEIVRLFCISPSRDVADAIIAACPVKKNLNLKERKFAGSDAKAVAMCLSRASSVDAVRPYLRQWLIPEDLHFVHALELFIAYAQAEDEKLIISSAAEFMERRREDLLNLRKQTHYRAEHYSEDALEKDYIRCREVIAAHDCARNANQLIEILDALTQTAFHAHRLLASRAEELAQLLQARFSEDLDLLESALRFIPPGRIHPAALRHVLAHTPERGQQRLSRVFARAPTALSGPLDATSSGRSAPIYDPDFKLIEAYDPEARIWPKNNAIVANLFAPVVHSRSAFAHLAMSQWERDEDALSERLVTHLFQELKNGANSPELRKWISENYGYGHLTVRDPYIRDKERDWGADIGLIVKYDVANTLHHEWAYLIQAKKSKGEHPAKPSRWDIDRAQLEDLLLTTSAGFYLLYSPLDEPGTPFVLPARAILSALEAIEKHQTSTKGIEAKSIPYSTGRNLGKSWASFLLEDVIGAWSGDADPDLLQRMDREGNLAQVVFEVTVYMGRG
jgi:hypothetical protein